jgi:hypothetical protein
MKRYTFILIALTVMASVSSSASAQSRATAGFEKLKSLAGEWQGKTSEGLMVEVSYKITSGGSALMETLKAADEAPMVTLYHLDSDSLLMTHYCSAGNQPRLRATVGAGEVKSLTFKFLDVTNLANPSDGYICGLSLTFVDKDHIIHEWAFRQGGNEAQSKHSFARKK